MQITKDAVALFHYHLQEVGGDFSETSRDAEPQAYLHGHNGLLPAMEAALEGLETGDTVNIELTPKQAYGERDDTAVQRVPIKHLVNAPKRIIPGMVVAVNTQQGARQVVVLKVGKFNVDVDTNHPLAGKTVVFDIEIIDVREATAEEISQGHPQGVDDQQH